MPATDRYLAWIDGVGAWLILTGDSVSIGRVNGNLSPLVKTSLREPEADIALVANLSRQHATIDRVDDDYLLKPDSSVSIRNQRLSSETPLPDECEILLGDTVRLSFSVPTPLSATARLIISSDHRPRTTVDGIILMAETCLLGPSASDHIRCQHWSDTVILVQTSEGLVVKSKQEIQVGARRAKTSEPVSGGEVISGDDFRFRLEPLN